MSKGAFPYTGTCMPKSKSGLTGSGKMSSAHGTNTGNAYHAVKNAGATTVGKGVRGFKSGIPGNKAPMNDASKHAKQPSGHKSKA